MSEDGPNCGNQATRQRGLGLSELLAGQSPEAVGVTQRVLWTHLNGGLSFAFVALLIVLPLAYAVVPLLAGGLLLLGLLAGRAWAPGRARLDREDGLLLLALLLYGGAWLLDVWRSGQWPAGEGNQGVLLPLWPWLAAGLLVWLRWYSPGPRVLWWAVGCGALGAGAIALHERWVLGYARAHNQMNAIPFGNLSLLLGMLSLLAALWCLRRGYVRNPYLLALSLLAAFSGMLASLLSGTRGGWIAMPLLLILAYRAAQELVPERRRDAMVGLVIVVLLGIAALPQSGVGQRVALAVSQVEEYWQGEARGSSVGLRLEMWRGGAMLFRERPLIGWGEGRLELAMAEQVVQGNLHPGVQEYDQLHSDLIDTAARRGLLGVAVLLTLYMTPMWLFWRWLRQPGADPGTKVLAAAGLMVPVAFIDFGLTQSMLRDVRGLSGYLGLCVTCWVVLRAHSSLNRCR